MRFVHSTQPNRNKNVKLWKWFNKWKQRHNGNAVAIRLFVSCRCRGGFLRVEWGCMGGVGENCIISGSGRVSASRKHLLILYFILKFILTSFVFYTLSFTASFFHIPVYCILYYRPAICDCIYILGMTNYKK